MSKRTNEQSQKPNSTLRVRWVEVELNGGDSTIEEALRTVERMRRPVIEAPAALKRVAHTAAPGNGSNGSQHPLPLFDDQEEIDGDDGAELHASDDTVVEAEVPRKKRGAGDPKDYNAGIKPVGDVDFIPNGKESLKELFAEKNPTSDMDQILVICHFLQHTAQVDKIGPGHVLSGFNHVKKPVPKDLKQTIRNMKTKKAWLRFADMDDIHVTTEGDNRVEHELGKGANGAGTK
jgi:hypothetical protein